MPALYDHLIAVVAGVILLSSLLVLQTRDRLAAVEAVLADGSRARAEAVLDVVARDTDNLLPRAQADILIGGAYPTRLVRADSLTAVYTLATLVRSAPGAAAVPAVVRYTTTATGDSATVAGVRLARYRLERQVGTDRPRPLGVVTDFGVAFGAASGPLVRDGAPPTGVSHVQIRVAVAAQGSGRVAQDQASTRATLVSRAETTVRPQNLGPAR